MKFSFAALLIVFAATSADAAEVRLRSSAGCSTAVIRLLDVAEIFAEDSRVAQSLAEVPLCPAPAAGVQKCLSQDDIRQLLALSGVERKMVQVTGSETVAVTAESSSHSSTGIKRPLVASGVRQASFETATEPDPKSRATRPPAKAAASTPAETKQPALVERGTLLTIMARTAGVRITTSGKALGAGALGDTIDVELADSKQRVLARLTGPQTAEITTGSQN